MTDTKSRLAAHVAKLRAAEDSSPKARSIARDSLLYWGEHADKNYLTYLKPCVGSATVLVRLESVSTLTSIKMYCKQKDTTRIISSSLTLLRKLLNWDKKRAPSLSNYAGSYFKIDGMTADDPAIEIVFIPPLKQLVTVPYGRFLTTRLISKLTKPAEWYAPTEFKGFDILRPENEAELFWQFKEAALICIDVETLREDARIRCLSYTAFFMTPSGYTSHSVVLPIDSEYSVAIMQKWNWELKAGKIMQNGKYDIAYFARYNAPVYKYLYDTANMFHCWLAELPKDLGFLNGFLLREAVYWKDLAETDDLYEYYRYNALDTWGTGNAFLAMLFEAPAYAISNYLLEFPLVFPCHMSEMRGLARDMDKLGEAKAEQDAIISKHTKSLNVMLDVKAGTDFNVNSPIQMKAMLKIIGCQDLKSADAKNLDKARYRHPLNARIINSILKVRKARKLVSTYLTPGKEFNPLIPREGVRPRILFSLNPHGTDTSRLASKEHHFWCGLQVQNMPRGKAVKQTIIADDGFYFCEADLSQAESRDTGYISGDEHLIHNVEFSPDFHCSNASAFFGVPFEEMFDIATGKVLNKPLRQIGKPVNHGANYNMGAYVLIDTMGEEKIVLAKKLLGLPVMWSYVRVAEYLLEQFHKTYPNIKGVFYKGVIQEVTTTGRLQSLAQHHIWSDASKLDSLKNKWALDYDNNYNPELGAWTRRTFGDPSKSKSQLNSYIAHPPQSLNAQTLNKSYLSVFHDIAINPQHAANFKLGAQIHDSILFQYRAGHSQLIDMVVERMEVPVTIRAYDKKIRTFVVPAEAKSGKHLAKGHSNYWSENE